MGYGLSAAARGNTFPWVFNPPATYWDGLSMIISHMGSEIGGQRKLAGLKLGYVYLDSGYGREPIALFQKLAESFGFELKLYPVAVADMQKQSAHWKQIMADGRDYVVMFGWGGMNPAGVTEAINAGFPMTRLFSIWWLGEADLAPLGEKATGLKTLNWHNVGQNYPLLQDILKHVVDAGKSQVKSRDEVGQLLYNRGVYNSMLISEAIRTAQKLAGKAMVNGDDVRKGLENLTIDHMRLREIGLDGFAEPIALSCADHNGHRPAYIQQWHTSKWQKLSGRIQPMTLRLEPLIDAAERAYVQQNAPWPERTVPCEKPS
jgi:branched-chain amino acid transport system substrate-binding protein